MKAFKFTVKTSLTDKISSGNMKDSKYSWKLAKSQKQIYIQNLDMKHFLSKWMLIETSKVITVINCI